jgi:hypothetical protein
VAFLDRVVRARTHSGTIALWAAALVLSALFLREGVGLATQTHDDIVYDLEFTEFPALPYSDFPMFYAGAALITSAERAGAYDKHTIVRHIYEVRGMDGSSFPRDFDPDGPNYVWQRYYNPPFFLAALSPLTWLDVETAFVVSAVANVAILAVLAALMGAILRWRQPHTLLMVLAAVAFSPVYFSLHHGQPTILLACLLAGGYLALRSEHRLLALPLLAATGLKPHWLLPAMTAVAKSPRRLALLAGMSSLLLLAPFLLVGPGAALDYVALVLDRGQSDLTDPNYSGALLSWAGFFRAFTGETQPVLWLGASLLTLTLFAVVFLRADEGTAMAAAVLTVLMVIPHSHPQDWVLLLPAAAILLSRQVEALPAVALGLCLLSTFWAANQWPDAQAAMDRDGRSVYWITLAAFALLSCVTALELARDGVWRINRFPLLQPTEAVASEAEAGP